MKLRKSLAFVGIAILTAATGSQAYATETSELQQQIDTVLAKTTGGVQISPNEIAWEGGEVIMSFPLPGEETAPPSSQAATNLQAKAAGISKQSIKDAVASGKSLAASDNCPTEVIGNDWYCFYQYKDFGGRRLQWNQAKGCPATLRRAVERPRGPPLILLLCSCLGIRRPSPMPWWQRFRPVLPVT
ncbi:hypothetical protein [Streptomyces sp. NPDC017524]|uniref:hypothetical protein n=1 Tax=Streptomyces sp. NPDC017524 TaxID=3364999 RepID=UPI0037BB1155